MPSENYLGNPLLKAAHVQVEYTEDSLKEYMTCAKDPIHFSREYVKIIHVDRGLVKFDLYDYQEEMVNTFHNNRFVICKMPRQSGKCFDINTTVRVRNKKTGEIKELTVGELYDKIEAKTNSENV